MLPKSNTKPGSLACRRQRGTPQQWYTPSTYFSEGAKTLLGSDASTAESLTAQWSATDEALIAEESLLGERTALQAVRESVRCALVAAEDLRAYLARSKDEWTQLDSMELLSDHLYTFPDLEHDDPFIKHLQDVLDLPLTDGAIVAGEGPSHAVEIEEENVNVFRVLYQNAHRLQGIGAPVFVVHQGKVWARYFHEGSLSLADFEAMYEVDHEALNMVFASVTSAAGSFLRHVGRQHGNIDSGNVFVDAVAGRVTLGPHAPSIAKSDVAALTDMVEQLALANGFLFTPRAPFKVCVECHGCSSPCARSTICPGGDHVFCEQCVGNLMNSQTKQNGAMAQLSCPMARARDHTQK